MNDRPIRTLEIWQAATDLEINELEALSESMVGDKHDRWFWDRSEQLYLSIATHRQIIGLWTLIHQQHAMFYADDIISGTIALVQSAPPPVLRRVAHER